MHKGSPVNPNIWFTPEEIVDSFILSANMHSTIIPSSIRDQFTPEEILKLETPTDVSSNNLVTLGVMGWNWESIKNNVALMGKIQEGIPSFPVTKIAFLQSVGILAP